MLLKIKLFIIFQVDSLYRRNWLDAKSFLEDYFILFDLVLEFICFQLQFVHSIIIYNYTIKRIQKNLS